MTITPFADLKSEDILSAHISGLQHAINKIETVLNEKTTAVTGHALVAVTDQADTNLHNLIYEGTVRNWLTAPAPVVKRNGTVVATSEYKIEPAYGVVVFYAQQNPSDAITADITYVSGGSTVIDGINQSVTDNATNISANTSAIALRPIGASKNAIIPTAAWLTNYKSGGGLNSLAASSISQASNTIDCFPIWITKQMTFDKLKATASKDTVATNVILGIYSDNGGWPGTLLAGTTAVAVAAGDTVNNVDVIQTIPDLVLQPGLYWLARYQSSGAKFEGVTVATPSIVIDIADPDDATLINGSYNLTCCGTRSGSMGSLSALPTTYPALSTTNQYLKRPQIGLVWIHKKA